MKGERGKGPVDRPSSAAKGVVSNAAGMEQGKRDNQWVSSGSLGGGWANLCDVEFSGAVCPRALLRWGGGNRFHNIWTGDDFRGPENCRW